MHPQSALLTIEDDYRAQLPRWDVDRIVKTVTLSFAVNAIELLCVAAVVAASRKPTGWLPAGVSVFH